MGRLKEAYWRDACAEYLKRLTRYGRPELIEVDDLPEQVFLNVGTIEEAIEKAKKLKEEMKG